MAITITTIEYMELMEVLKLSRSLIDSLSYEDYLHKFNYHKIDKLRQAIDIIEKRQINLQEK